MLLSTPSLAKSSANSPSKRSTSKSTVYKNQAKIAPEVKNPLKDANLSSPRDTLRSFIDNMNKIFKLDVIDEHGPNHEEDMKILSSRIINCLDISHKAAYQREYTAREAATLLKEILDRVPIPSYSKIPGIDEVNGSGDAKAIDKWVLPTTNITIERIKSGAKQGYFQFSKQTVNNIHESYKLVKDMPYKKRNTTEGIYEYFRSKRAPDNIKQFTLQLPDQFRKRYFGQLLWQWIAIIVILLVSILFMGSVYYVGGLLAKRFKESSIIAYCITLLFPITAATVPLIVKDFLDHYMSIAGPPIVFITLFANIIFILALMVVVMGAGTRVAEIAISSPSINARGIDAQLIRLVCRSISLIALFIIAIEGGKYLGVPVTALVTSAGIGGLAVALSAQDTLKTFFGTIMIVLDKPFVVGERILVDDYDGVVESVGIRSTKIRLLTGHLVSITNDEMATANIENIARRPYIKKVFNISLPIDTPPDRVSEALKTIRQIFVNHEGMSADKPAKIHFEGFTDDSIVIQIIYWYHPADYWKFLEFGEKVNIKIMKKLNALNIHMLPKTIAVVKKEKQYEDFREIDQLTETIADDDQ